MIAAANLRGPFVVDAGKDLLAIGQEDRSDQLRLEPVVAVTIDLLMKLVSGHRREWTVLVGQSSAIGIAVRTVGTTVAADITRNRAAGAGEVAAAPPR